MSYKEKSPIIVAEGGTGAGTFTSHGVLLGNTTSAITATAAGTTGQILTGITGSAPTFQSPAASSITITGDSGGGLTGNSFTFTGGTTGLTFAGSGTTETLGGTLVVANGGTGAATLTGVLTGNSTSAVTASTVTQNGVLYGGASNAVSSTGVGATGTVLVGTTSSAPSYSATPTLTSITFGSGSALSNYVTNTGYTPTLLGGSTAGATTYNIQQGYYTRIGNLIHVDFSIQITAATGTGNMQISLPFTATSATNYIASGPVSVQGGSYTWPASFFMCTLYLTTGNSFVNIIGSKTLSNGAFFQMASTTITIAGSITYSV